MFTCRSLSFRYPKQTQFAISDANVTIETGSFTTLIGANGSGKSTFIKLLGGLLDSFDGDLFFNETNIQKIKPKNLAKEIAYVPQTPEILFSMTVEEMVSTGCAPYLDWWGSKNEFSENQVNEALKLCELEMVRFQPIHHLSGGEKQRVWIAKALVQNTNCILLDEPTAHLDIRHQADVFKLLKSLQMKYNKTIIVACHDLNLASHFGTNAILFRKGHILAAGTIDDVFKPNIIEAGFSVPVNINEKTKQVSVHF